MTVDPKTTEAARQAWTWTAGVMRTVLERDGELHPLLFTALAAIEAGDWYALADLIEENHQNYLHGQIQAAEIRGNS